MHIFFHQECGENYAMKWDNHWLCTIFFCPLDTTLFTIQRIGWKIHTINMIELVHGAYYLPV
jgi:hypothetical protein